jgi:hypothetical protein
MLTDVLPQVILVGTSQKEVLVLMFGCLSLPHGK